MATQKSIIGTPPFLFSIIFWVFITQIGANYWPRHLHLSIRYEDTMTVTWSTKDLPDNNYIEYGSSTADSLKNSKKADKTLPHTSKSRNGDRTQYIHEVTLKDLTPGRSYYYRCLSSRNAADPLTRWSKTFRFTMPKSGTEWGSNGGGPKLIFYGDLGFENAVSLPFVDKEIDSGAYDAIVHVGDIAYELHANGGETGDNFMELIEKVAARIPYHVCPGNHEVTYGSEKDGSNGYHEYKGRFRMADDFDSMMYSWNLGPVHFLSFNTENYFYSQKYIQRQYDWIKNDLEAANQNRAKRPWLIVYAHTPMYCQAGAQACGKWDNPVRVGSSNNPSSPSLEELFYKNGVDLLLWGHAHYYQSSFPMYKTKVMNSSQTSPFKNPKGLVHIITGAAGSKYRQKGFRDSQPHWTRFRTTNYGYTRLNFQNRTHLGIEQVDVTAGTGTVGKVIDRFTLIRERHGSY